MTIRHLIIGLAGWSGAGKTTLVVRLLPELIGRGLKVSTIKHAHHTFDVDDETKDSYRHRSAGAREVLVSSARRFALMSEHDEGGEPGLPVLLTRLAPCDLVLVEGFKRAPHAKIEIHRRANNKPLLYPDDPAIRAIACDSVIEGARLPLLDLNDIPAIADACLRFAAPFPDNAG